MKVNNFLKFILKILLSGLLLLYLFYFTNIVDFREVIETLKKTELMIFILAFITCLSTVLFTAKRWSLFLPENIKYSRLVSLVFIGYFFNTFLPGRLGGEILRTFYIYRDIGKGYISIASVFMDKYMGFSATVGISLMAFIVGFANFKKTEIVLIITLSCSIFLLASLIFWGVNWGRIKKFTALYHYIMEYKKKKGIICTGLLLSFIIQVINIIVVYLLSLSIGLSVPIIYFFIFVPIISTISGIPITIAGLGLREVGFAALFGMFFKKLGVTSDQAVSLSILYFSSMTLVNLIGGIEYLRIRKLPEMTRD